MINVKTKEYAKGDLAFRETKITFCFIPIFRYKKETTSRQAVNILSVNNNKQLKIKGFRNETKNKSKKNK